MRGMTLRETPLLYRSNGWNEFELGDGRGSSVVETYATTYVLPMSSHLLSVVIQCTEIKLRIEDDLSVIPLSLLLPSHVSGQPDVSVLKDVIGTSSVYIWTFLLVLSPSNLCLLKTKSVVNHPYRNHAADWSESPSREGLRDRSERE